MLIAVEIASFAVHAEKNTPLIILKETGGERTLAAPIATPEASAIAIKSLNVRCETALTIDVLKTVVESLGGKLDKVVIRAAGNDFSARLHIFSESAHYDAVEQPDDQILVIKEFLLNSEGSIHVE